MTASLRVTCSTGYHSLSKRDWRQWKSYGGKHLATMLNQDFKEFAGLLTSNWVDVLIVGAGDTGRHKDLADLEMLDDCSSTRLE